MVYIMLAVSAIAIIAGVLLMPKPTGESALMAAAVFALQAIAIAIHERKS